MFNAIRWFNLLILEEGENYLTDCAATIETTYPQSCALPENFATDNLGSFESPRGSTFENLLKLHSPEKGRLRICSKSIIFEPDNVSADILKVPLRKIVKLNVDPGNRIIELYGKEIVRVHTVVFNGKTRCVSPYTVNSASKALPASIQKESLGGRKDGSASSSLATLNQQMQSISGSISPSAKFSNSSNNYNDFSSCDSRQVPNSSFVYFFSIRLQSHYFSSSCETPVAAYVYEICVSLWKDAVQHEKSLSDVVANELEKLTKFLRFDLSRLDHREQVLLHTVAGLWVDRVKPLIHHKGLFQVTTDGIFFQPYPNFSNKPIRRIAISSVLHIFRRVSSLRANSLEIIADVASEKGRKWKCFLVDFADNATREYVANILEKLNPKVFQIQNSRDFLNHIMSLWQKGLISNFHYLDFLNCIAGRSRNDFSQYPVFPWVLSDYSSSELDLNNPQMYRDLTKPVGALNASRLESLIERMQHLDLQLEDYRETRNDHRKTFSSASSPAYIEKHNSESGYLYGSHYSTPAFVVHWLVRLLPECQLRLHSGRFDAWMRMFHSMESSYKGVLSGQSTFMELVPEFYQQSPDFLINRLNVVTSEGTLDDVELPPWASSPTDFLNKMRAALESDYVSRYLPDWIDLIFGYKQRGEEARQAYNLFHPLTYANASVAVSSGSCSIGVPNPISPVVEKLISEMNAEALEVQLQEFGQTPIQLFSSPHLRRLVCPRWQSVSWSGDRWRDSPWFIYLLHHPQLLTSTPLGSDKFSHASMCCSIPSAAPPSPLLPNMSVAVSSIASLNATCGSSDYSKNMIERSVSISNASLYTGTNSLSNKMVDTSAAVAGSATSILNETLPLSPDLLKGNINGATSNDKPVCEGFNTRSGEVANQGREMFQPPEQLTENVGLSNVVSSALYNIGSHSPPRHASVSHRLPVNAWTIWSRESGKTRNNLQFVTSEFKCRDVEGISIKSDNICIISQDGCLRMTNPLNIFYEACRKQRCSASPLSSGTANFEEYNERQKQERSYQTYGEEEEFVNKVAMSYKTFRVSQMPLSSVTHLHESQTLAVGAFDGSIAIHAYQHSQSAELMTNAATGSTGGAKFEWGGAAKVLDRQFCHADTVTCLSFEKYVHGLVSGSADQTVRAWTVAPSGLAVVHVFDELLDEVTSVSARDSLVLAASADGNLVLWDLRSPTSLVWTSRIYPAYSITHCAISDRYVVAFAPKSCDPSNSFDNLEDFCGTNEGGPCCHSIYPFSDNIPFHFWDLRKSNAASGKRVETAHANVPSMKTSGLPGNASSFGFSRTSSSASAHSSQYSLGPVAQTIDENIHYGYEGKKYSDKSAVYSGLSDGGRYALVAGSFYSSSASSASSGGGSTSTASCDHTETESNNEGENRLRGVVSLWDIHNYRQLKKWTLHSIIKPKFVGLWPYSSLLENESWEIEGINMNEETGESNGGQGSSVAADIGAYIAVVDGEGRIELMGFNSRSKLGE